MAKYFLTKKAVEDISKVWDYTYGVWSENQADKYYKLLIQTFLEIAGNPGIGKKYDEIEKNILGFHVGKHVVFYRENKLKEIVVLRILHERMNFKNRMGE